jgi:UDP-glucuronate 4-epimerase
MLDLLFHYPRKDQQIINEKMPLETSISSKKVQKERRKGQFSSSFRLLLSSFLVTFLCIHNTSASQQHQQPLDYLTKDSVVLITGAAGFLGSELALALHRTYGPKQIICVDRMSVNPSSQEELALFEFQRQRIFSVFQTLGSSGSFYRVDFRPMIPEYFDLGEVPVLDHIFREHPDITHVVHLADPFPHSALQVVFREKDVPKAGMMEALMEQLLKIQRSGKRAPNFVYGSSSDVYPVSRDQASPFEETHKISTPSTLRGASKLIDELLAKMYHDMHGIYSVGLRFFSVYGPWSTPGSPLFEMAERAITGDLPIFDPQWKNTNDYVYIDDAVDAMMAAMQFRPAVLEKETPIVFNVASGSASSLQQIANTMEGYFPQKRKDRMRTERTGNREPEDDSPATASLGATLRAETLLGYRPRVSLQDGIEKLLAWHFDRAFPFGGGKKILEEKTKIILSRGIASCLPNDRECLKSTPVFPCASECSHESQCVSSFYDEVVGRTQTLTKKCEVVLYTVDLDNNLESLPSAHTKVQRDSKSFLEGTCNLAFVSSNSRLFQSVSSSHRISSFFGVGGQQIKKQGQWILVPVNVPLIRDVGAEEDLHHTSLLSLLPKLSPGLFFSKAKRAIYIDPNILLDSIPKLLKEATVQPYNAEIEGRTAMLIGKGNADDYFVQEDEDFDFSAPEKVQKLAATETVIQNAAYRMVRIAVSDVLVDNGILELMDSRWMVHTLQSDDSRLFRCDVFGEVVQWDVDTDRSSLEFVLRSHDKWSRVIAKESSSGESGGAWWIGENVLTVPEGFGRTSRRLQEEDGIVLVDGDEDDLDIGDEGADGARKDEDAVADDKDVTAMQAEPVKEEEVNNGEMKHAGSSEDSEEGDTDIGDDEPADPAELLPHDYSSYDAWMGVLSASSVKYFVRIVPSSEVGVVSLDD